MANSANTCVMCDVALQPFVRPGAILCQRHDCRMSYERLPKTALCMVCSRPLAPRDLANRVCSAVACRQAVEQTWAQTRAERQRQAAERLLNDAQLLREQAAATMDIRESASYRSAVIPSFTAAVTDLPDSRRQAFRDGLERLIGETTEVGGDSILVGETQDSSHAADAVVGQACAQCRGDCCSNGADHAYLTVATLRRYVTAHPELQPEQVLAAYLERIGDKTYEGSCIFHQPAGCSLPRAMRSDTCNRHFCDGMAAFRRDLPAAGPVRGFFVTMADGSVQSAAFIDEAEVRLVRNLTP